MTNKDKKKRRRMIAESVKMGKVPAEVAKDFKVGKSTVYLSCIENGVEVPPYQGLPANSTFLIIADLIKTDNSLKKIGERFGITRERVRQIYQRALDAKIPISIRKNGYQPKR